MSQTAERMGIIGYGRFGRALGELCLAAGVELKAFDPFASIPADFAVDSLPALVRHATLIAVAVPLDQMRATFVTLAPLLRDEQAVMDVGSVKVVPANAMSELFGERTPWVATHPLFGPASLARGERPLRVVVCPNPQHPGAVERVRATYVRLGCVVIERGPVEHDQEMALTHALAFFVAKGMLDAGVPTHSPLAPPSFQGMARSIEAVRVDAGHLFAALHSFNPYAPEARRCLLEALTLTHQTLLGSGAGQPAPAPSALNIPGLGPDSPELTETRELIDAVDSKVLALLARPAEPAKQAGRADAVRGLGVVDIAREGRLLDARREAANSLGIPEDSIAEIFRAILRFSRGAQE